MNDFPAVWNYGNLSAKFLVSPAKDFDTVGFLAFFSSFTGTTIKIPVKFPAFTFNKPEDGQSQPRIRKLIRTLLLWGGGGGNHLNFAIPQGITKILLIQQGESLKIYKT